MKKKTSKTTAAKPVAKLTAKRGKGYGQLVTAISTLNAQVLGRVATVANQALVLRNWTVGAYIIEFEQNGSGRAKYGERLLKTLARDLAARGIKGLELRNLRNCRLLYLAYPQIRQTLSAELEARTNSTDSVCRIPGTASPELESPTNIPAALGTTIAAPIRIPSTLWTESALPIRQTVFAEFDPSPNSANSDCRIEKREDARLPERLPAEQMLRLSWSHFLELIRIDDPWKRAFYESELLQGHWSVRQLQRQIESLLYERTGLSTNKKAVVERARRQEPHESIADVLRDPYILEFTGLAERAEYSEDELESALLDHLQRFLLELGRGFCFEARQFRMTEGRKHHRVDWSSITGCCAAMC